MTRFNNPNRRYRRRRPIKDYCDIRFNGDLEGTIEYLANKIEVVAREAKERRNSRGRDRALKTYSPIEVFREFIRIDWTAHCDKINFQEAFRADRKRQYNLFIAVEQYLFDIVKSHFRKREYRTAEAYIRYAEKTIYGLRTDRVRRFLKNQAKRKPCDNPSRFERAVDEAMRLTDEGRHCSANKRFKEILSFENGSDAHWDYLEWQSTPEMTDFETSLRSKVVTQAFELRKQIENMENLEQTQDLWDQAHEADPEFSMISSLESGIFSPYDVKYGLFHAKLAENVLTLNMGEEYQALREHLKQRLGEEV